jgi:hypothetical protein
MRNDFHQSAVPRTWRIWERSENQPPFQLQERDIEIIRAIFLHRFLQPAHIRALLGGSAVNLTRRCRLLWQHGYLERPKSLRPTKILTEEIVYGLGKQGAQLLEHQDPRLRIGHLEWTETPKKQIGWPYIDHQLGIATFFVCLKIACDRRGIQLHWDGHFNRRRFRIRLPKDKYKKEKQVFLPDGYFRLEVPGRGSAHYFLEVDRGNVSLARMRERYQGYFLWWKDGIGKRSFKNFTVVTITDDPTYVNSLRQAAATVGRDYRFGRALLFSHAKAFDLDHPEQVLSPIFRYADEDTSVALV